jgi:phosphohistidine phosphatase SixA
MIVFVLRHGERDPDPADALTSEGKKRARLLALMLAENGVGVAFRSELKRNRQMLAPLETKLGTALAVHEVKLNGPGGEPAHIAGIVAGVKAQAAGAVVAVVTHSQTVGPIVAGLGGGPVTVGGNEFDKLFVFVIDAVGTTLLKLRYGVPIP